MTTEQDNLTMRERVEAIRQSNDAALADMARITALMRVNSRRIEEIFGLLPEAEEKADLT